MARLKGGADYGNFKDPSGRGQIERFSPEGVFMALYPWLRDGVVYIEDDFLEDTISGTKWNLAVDGGTTFAWSVGKNGIIRGATGAADNDAMAINGDITWYGDNNCGMEARWLAPAAVVNFSWELGWTDALDDETLPAVTDIDTPATGNGAVDTAVLHMDTDQTLQTTALVSESTTTGFAAQKVLVGTFKPTLSTWYKMRVQLNGNNVFCKIYDDTVPAQPVLVPGSEVGLQSAIEGGTAVRPHLYFRTRTTETRQIDIDYIRCWQDRV